MSNDITIPLFIFGLCFLLALVQNGVPKSRLEALMSMVAGGILIVIAAVIGGVAIMFKPSHFLNAILSDGYTSMLIGAGFGAGLRGGIGLVIFFKNRNNNGARH